jgi:hypothetical protein
LGRLHLVVEEAQVLSLEVGHPLVPAGKNADEPGSAPGTLTAMLRVLGRRTNAEIAAAVVPNR